MRRLFVLVFSVLILLGNFPVAIARPVQDEHDSAPTSQDDDDRVGRALTIEFEPGSDRLTEESKAAADEMLAYLAKNPDLGLVIGSEALEYWDPDRSAARLEALHAYLVTSPARPGDALSAGRLFVRDDVGPCHLTESEAHSKEALLLTFLLHSGEIGQRNVVAGRIYPCWLSQDISYIMSPDDEHDDSCSSAP